MKIPLSKILFFLFGLGAFVYLISRFGLDKILENIGRAGWSLLYIVGVWLVIYLLNALSWRLVLGDSAKKISFPQLFMVTVSGFVINYVTPVIALGGEPYKIKALSGRFGVQQSLSAVVLYRMVHLLGHMLLLFVGIVLALAVLSLHAAVVAALSLAGIVVAAIIYVTLLGQRNGIFERLHNLAQKIPMLRHLVGRIVQYQDEVRTMDDALTDVYRNRRGRFYLAVGLEFLSRVCMGFEVYLILYGIGIPVSLVSALFLYIMYSLVINILFFIPMNLGAREGGLALGLESLALAPLLGVYLGVVIRIREFVWILIGLLFIFFTTDKQESSFPKPS